MLKGTEGLTERISSVAGSEIASRLESVCRSDSVSVLTVTSPIISDKVALIVDDMKSNRQVLARKLKRLGFGDSNLYHCENGQKALDRLALLREQGKKEGIYVFLDEDMPVKTGTEVLAELQTDPNRGKLNIMMVTSHYNESEKVEEYKSLGVHEISDKNVPPEQLKNFVSQESVTMAAPSSRLTATEPQPAAAPDTSYPVLAALPVPLPVPSPAMRLCLPPVRPVRDSSLTGNVWAHYPDSAGHRSAFCLYSGGRGPRQGLREVHHGLRPSEPSPLLE